MGVAGQVPFGGTGVGPVHSGGVGRQGGRGPRRGGGGPRSGDGGPRSGVEGLDVKRLLLLGGRPEVRGSQRGRDDWSPPDREESRER